MYLFKNRLKRLCKAFLELLCIVSISTVILLISIGIDTYFPMWGTGVLLGGICLFLLYHLVNWLIIEPFFKNK